MSHDENAMVAAHKAGQQMARDEMAGVNSFAQVTAIQAATAKYKTVDERISFVSGYFGAKRRAAAMTGEPNEPR
jgi:hypothetical protein